MCVNDDFCTNYTCKTNDKEFPIYPAKHATFTVS